MADNDRLTATEISADREQAERVMKAHADAVDVAIAAILTPIYTRAGLIYITTPGADTVGDE